MSSSDREFAFLDADVAAKTEVLARLPLFGGIPEDELRVLAEATRPAETAAGEDVWSDGDEADGLYVIVSGRTSVLDQLPSEREFEVATLGPGGVLGEIPLLGGGPRWATVRAMEDTRFLFLGRVQFLGLLARATPGALTVRGRLLALACDRLRQRHEALAKWLGGGPAQGDAVVAAAWDPADAYVPDADYVRRLPFFRAFDRSAVVDVVGRGTVVELPRGYPVLAEGMHSAGCWITLNGAVEELIRRGDGSIRVGLPGPGHAFGYLGLIDGLSSSVAAVTRERSHLLFIAPDVYDALFDPARIGALSFREAIEHDLVRALRVSLRPQARLEAAH